MKNWKTLEKLTAEETIELLKKPPKELRKTPHARVGLIAWLYILYTKAFVSCDHKTQAQAEDFLVFLLYNGNREEKMLINAFHVTE